MTYNMLLLVAISYQLLAISFSNLLYDLEIFTNHPSIVQRQVDAELLIWQFLVDLYFDLHQLAASHDNW